MPDFTQTFPAALAQRIARLTISGVPCLLAHPDWLSPRPMLFWMHGRTVNKELDAGRYLRCIRAGIACCAIDLPGHGERSHPPLQSQAGTLDVLEQASAEIDRVLDALTDPAIIQHARNLLPHPLPSDATDLFNIDACAIGGMSLGGMTTLARLCLPHTFKAALLESTTGWLSGLYFPRQHGLTHAPWPVHHDPDRVRGLDPMARIAGTRPIPILALHSESDVVVPWPVQRAYLDALRSHYAREGASPVLVRAHTWPTTGAPDEHAGFGRVASEAKSIAIEFLASHLATA